MLTPYAERFVRGASGIEDGKAETLRIESDTPNDELFSMGNHSTDTDH